MAGSRTISINLFTNDHLSKGFKKSAKATDNLTDKMQRLNRTASRNVLDKVAKSVTKLTKKTVDGTKAMTKFSAVVGGLSAGAGSAAAAASSVIQLTAALAPAVGILAALPGATALAVTGLVTLKLALSKVGDAFSAALGSDQEAFKESLKDLTPAARRVAKELHSVRVKLIEIRNVAQQRLFEPLRGEVLALTKVLAGPLKIGVGQLARELGRAAKSLSMFAREKDSVKAIQSLFRDTALSVRNIAPGLAPLARGFRDIAVVGGSFIKSLTPALGAALSEFGKFLSAAAKSGKAFEWMREGLAVLQQLFRILGNVGSIISSVFKAANASGGGLLNTIEGLTGQFARFLKSTEGVKALRAIFAGIGEIGKALGPVIIDLVKGIGVLAPAIGRIAQAVGPVLSKAINALAPALKQLEPGITALINGLGDAFTAIAPVLPIVARALSSVAVAIAPILPALGKLIAMLAGQFADIIQRLVDSGAMGHLVVAVIEIANALGQGLLDALIAIAPYLPQLVINISNLLIALIPLIPPLVDLVIALTPIIPMFTDIIELITDLTSNVLPILVNSINTQVLLTKGYYDAVKWAWDHIFKYIKWQIENIGKAIDWFKTLPQKFGTWFKGARDGATKKLGELVDWVKGLPNRITSALGKTGDLLYNAGAWVIQGLINGIVSKFNSLRDILGSVTRAIPDWKGPFDKDKVLLTPAGTAIMGGLIKGITGQLPALRATLGAVTATIAPGTRLRANVSASGGTSPLSAAQSPLSLVRTSSVVTAPVHAGGVSSGGSTQVVLGFEGSGNRLESLLLELIRNLVTVKGGGNVQKAFGR